MEPPDTVLGDCPSASGERRVGGSGAGSYDEGSVVAGRWDGWKFIHSGGERYVYDLGSHPGKNASVIKQNREAADRFREESPDYLFESDSPGTRTTDDTVDEQHL